jgi:hypothetical protein
MAKHNFQSKASFVYHSAEPDASQQPAPEDSLESHKDNASYEPTVIAKSVVHDGYRGIWFELGAQFEFGDKYSGGLGTYTSNHLPMAQYVAEVNKTFFVYGGTPSADLRQLIIFISFYDHSTGTVPRPVALYMDPSVDDPHDNASLHVDRKGYVWVFKSGRGRIRPGLIFRTTRPYDLSEFENVAAQEFTYPQIWTGAGDQGMFLFFTKYYPGTTYGPARHLFWKRSEDGRTWSEDFALAEFGGHYQTSGRWTGPMGETKFATFFNYHPESHVDRRTNVYYAQTVDGGRSWTAANGDVLDLPLRDPKNAALVLPLEDEEIYMYSCDLNFDRQGNPILLFILSRAGEPGPAGDPREWVVLHWDGTQWVKHVVTRSDHNYDMGSLYVEGDSWRIIGPTGEAPQQWGTGGEMETWVNHDLGKSWHREGILTAKSRYNHSYARRPLNAHPDFSAFWADGDATKLSPSHLYFSNIDGSSVYRLPYKMDGDFAEPQKLPTISMCEV